MLLMLRPAAVVFALATGSLVLDGCAEVQLVAYSAKEIMVGDSDPGRGPPVPAGYKVGQPYEVAGIRYHPRHEPDYDQVGIASWYGSKFHGRRTANGEVFDMNDLTAAHKTLALPSRVRVTNLENGRSLTLRLNDRGPFVDDRIIDISRRGAQLLGFHRKGLAEVRVQYLGLAELSPDRRVAEARTEPAAPDQPVLFRPDPGFRRPGTSTARRAARAGDQSQRRHRWADAGGTCHLSRAHRPVGVARGGECGSGPGSPSRLQGLVYCDRENSLT